MDKKAISVFAVDVGSVKKGNFGWCKAMVDSEDNSVFSSSSINELIKSIRLDLDSGMKVALGFECPLTVNLSDKPEDLTSARKGEGDRAWCAGAGCGALAVGLVECAWTLERIRESTICRIIPTLDWNCFVNSNKNLFLWEAFVTSKAKGVSHEEDAIISVKSFLKAYPYIASESAVKNDSPYSLIGAAILRSGLSEDMGMLSQDCIVIKAGDKQCRHF